MMTRSPLTDSEQWESQALRDTYLEVESSASPTFDAATSWKGVADRLDTEAPRESSRSVPRRRTPRTWGRRGVTMGAALAVLVGIGVAVQHTDILSRTEATGKTPNIQVVATRPGQRATITLPDGSKVTIGVASRLEYPQAFTNGRRRVVLDGEAVFTVMQDEGMPFEVETDGVVTTVLGTTFNVRKYATDSVVRVTVAEGRVGVANTILASGDQIAVSHDGNAILSREANVGSVLGWTTGRLTLDAIPLREAIPDLERWYGVTFAVRDDRLLARTVRVVLEHETAFEAADLIGFLIHARAVRSGNTITWIPN